MNLVELRKKCGYKSQKAFSQALGIKQTTVCMWEVGKSIPRLTALPHIAKVLGVDVADIVMCLDKKITK